MSEDKWTLLKRLLDNPYTILIVGITLLVGVLFIALK